jgi:hypothetical protein
VSEAVSERCEINGAPSPDDAEPVIGRAFARPVGIAGRTMMFGQTSGATSFETRAAPAPQDEVMKPML